MDDATQMHHHSRVTRASGEVHRLTSLSLQGARMHKTIERSLTSMAILTACFGTPMGAQQATPNWSSVEEALGRKGAMQPGNIIKFSFPRSDLAVTVGGVRLKPALALGGWVAFKETGIGQAAAMGDLVLTEDEVSPVMRALQAGGVEQ